MTFTRSIAAAEPFATAGTLCSGTIVFYGGADGYSILGQIAPFQVTFGQMFSAGLPYSASAASGSRTVIRAEITLSPYKVLTDTGSRLLSAH